MQRGNLAWTLFLLSFFGDIHTKRCFLMARSQTQDSTHFPLGEYDEIVFCRHGTRLIAYTLISGLGWFPTVTQRALNCAMWGKCIFCGLRIAWLSPFTSHLFTVNESGVCVCLCVGWRLPFWDFSIQNNAHLRTVTDPCTSIVAQWKWTVEALHNNCTAFWWLTWIGNLICNCLAKSI